MKRSLFILVLAALTLFGCSPAKKIAPENLPAPGVYDVTYSPLDLKDTPDQVRGMVEKYRGRDTATVTYLEQGLFLLVTKPVGTQLRIKKAARTVTNNGNDQLKVDIETVSQGQNPKNDPPVLVARLNLNSAPDFSGFEFTKVDLSPPGKPPVTPGKPPVTPPAKQESPYLQVFEPIQGDTITSPFVLRGLTRIAGGTVNIKLQDSAGRTLTETTTTSDFGGSFTTQVSYPSPSSPREGTLTITVRGLKSFHQANIRVTIK